MSDPSAPPPDFLDRLVMKALGTAALPLPRVPSFYEPPPSGDAPDPGDALGTRADADDTAARPAVRVARSAVASRPVVDPAGARPPADHAAAAQARVPRVALTAAASDPAVRAAGLRPDAPRQPRVGPADRWTEAVGTATPPPGAIPDRIAPAEPARGARAVGRAALEPVERPAPFERRDAEGDAGVPREAPDAPDDGAEPAEAVLLPRATGLAPPAASRDRRARRGAEGPADGGRAAAEVAVHVTIGRVEVKATPPRRDPASRPASRGPQPIALEEYLGQRGAR